jgi:hypothetical protein
MGIGCLECIAISWIYGGERWAKDLEVMQRRKPSFLWIYMWKFVTPTLLVAVLLFSLLDYVPVSYNGIDISYVLDGSIWVLNVLLISIIPITYVRHTWKERRISDASSDTSSSRRSIEVS